MMIISRVVANEIVDTLSLKENQNLSKQELIRLVHKQLKPNFIFSYNSGKQEGIRLVKEKINEI